MISILKKPDDYVLNSLVFKTANSCLYGCYTELNGIAGELDSSEKYTKDSRTILTAYDVFYFSPSQVVKAKLQYDFSDNLDTFVKGSSLTTGDYLYIPFSKEDLTVNPILRISSYLHDGKYDIAYADSSLLSELKVPEWFLLRYLSCGVPDNEAYNSLIEIYLLQNNLSVTEFKSKLLEDYTARLSPNLKITKGFINLALVNLSGFYNKNSKNISYRLDDFDEAFNKQIILFLSSHGIKYEITETDLVIKSYLVTCLFMSDFNNYSFLNTLSPILKKQVLLYLKLFKRVTGSKISLVYVQDFLNKCGKILSNIDTYDSQYSILTILKESEDYIKIDEGFLVPILSIEEVSHSSLLQLNIREINDN